MLVLIRTACMPKAGLTLSAAALAALALPLLPPQPPEPQAATARQGDLLGLAQPDWVPGAALAEELVYYSPQVNTSIHTHSHKPCMPGFNESLRVCVHKHRGDVLQEAGVRIRYLPEWIGSVKRHVPGSTSEKAALDCLVADRCT